MTTKSGPLWRQHRYRIAPEERCAHAAGQAPSQWISIQTAGFHESLEFVVDFRDFR
jgi:hypothetical protein